MSATPFSYRQYAGNGSTTTFSVPFPYLLKAHVKVYLGFSILDGTFTGELAEGAGFTWSSGTQITCAAAPATGQTLTVIRQTPSTLRLVDWQDGSNLIANDLDTADLQNLYVAQEQQDRTDASAAAAVAAKAAGEAATAASTAATATANSATAAAAAATTTANAASATSATALSQSGTAITDSAAALAASANAVTTAGTAATNAANAVATAGTASTNAAAAVNTANTAAANAATALSQSSTSLTNSATALSTANTAASNATTALTQSATASTNSSNAVTTANTASTNAASAVTTANTANAKADSAIAAISSSAVFTPVANVAAIPASPSNGQNIQVTDSTGIESFTPLAGLPAGFTGDSGIAARIQYSGGTWNWFGYFATNSDARYLKLSEGVLTGQLKADDSTSVAAPVYSFDGDTNTGLAHTGADELALVTGGVARLTFDASGAASFTNSVTIPAGSTVTGYLDTATAASTYQTQAGMSSYAPLASPTFTGQPYVNGSYRGNVTAVAALNIDCSLANYFAKTISSNSTFTVSNVPASRAYAFTLELTHTSGTVTWFSGVEWPGGTAPTLTTGKTHLFLFVTQNGGTRWRASSLINYTN